MVLPLQDKLEDWKKSVNTLDKEHAKEYKKLRSDIKKKTENSLRVQKKNRKNKDPKSRKLVEQVGIIDFDLFSQLFSILSKNQGQLIVCLKVLWMMIKVTLLLFCSQFCEDPSIINTIARYFNEKMLKDIILF